MKILLLGDASSAHIIKWANAINLKGVKVLVFGLSASDHSQYHANIDVEIFKIPEAIRLKNDGNLLKAIYLAAIPTLKRIFKSSSFDILHAQSASSYGLLGALTGFHPYMISVWGNDVYIFPHKNKVYKKILKYSLQKADMITSSSRTMAEYSTQFVDKQILVTPGGIVLEKFKPMTRSSVYYNPDDIVIGTVKMMETKYGSEDILEAFNQLKKKFPHLPLKLLMVGRGSLIQYLIEKAKRFGIEDSVRFTGPVPFSEIQNYHNMLDIYLAPSTNDSESFGVGILEASACGKPVIVSNVGGLPEVIVDGETGFMIPPNRSDILAEKIEKLVINKELRLQMGRNGRKFVEDVYDYDKITDYIISLYSSLLVSKKYR